MPFAQFETFIQEQVTRTKLAGIAAAMIKDGEIIWSRGFGHRDLANGLPATPDTLYCIGSITKSFTVLAALQLAAQGKLSHEDPVSRYLPRFTLKPGGEDVRLWHLMSHSSGIPALAYAEQVITAQVGGGGTPLPIASADDILTFMADAGDWALNKPGERWYYFNEGYVLLGEIIAQVSGMPYADYIAEHILKPLQMERSCFERARFEADSNTAVPYHVDRNNERLPRSYLFGQIMADGGLISSVNEMANYVQTVLNGGIFNGKRIIPEKYLMMMQATHVLPPEHNNPFGPLGYGYGLRILPNFCGQRVIGHGGSVGIATANMQFIPKLNMGVVVLANGSGYPMSQFALYGLALLMGQDPETLPFVQHERRLEALTGVYETYRGTMRAEIKRSGDFLAYEEHDKLNDYSVTLLPDQLGDAVSTFYEQSSGGVQTPVEFRSRNGHFEMLYGRYLFRRTGRLS